MVSASRPRPSRNWWSAGAGICLVLTLILGLAVLRATPRVMAQATPVAACTPARAPQPVPTPTRPAWAGEEPHRPLAPNPEAVLDPLIPGFLDHAIARYAACWNAGDWPSVVSGATPRFLSTAFDVPTDPAALARLGLGPLTIRQVSPPRAWSDGRVATEVLYERGSQVIAERWFFLVTHGDALLDEAIPLALPPLGDRVVLGLTTASPTAPWQWRSTPPDSVPAVPLTLLAAANRTPVPRTLSLRDASGQVRGFMVIPAGSDTELGLVNLPPGTYTISSTESPDSEPAVLLIAPS